jgi:hypothetical protein
MEKVVVQLHIVLNSTLVEKELIFTPDHFTRENSRVTIEWEAGLNSEALKKKPLAQSGIKTLLLSRPTRSLDTVMAKSIYRVGTAVAQWLRFCATNRKVAGSIPGGVIGFFL